MGFSSWSWWYGSCLSPALSMNIGNMFDHHAVALLVLFVVLSSVCSVKSGRNNTLVSASISDRLDWTTRKRDH
jgi:hypothetical protein